MRKEDELVLVMKMYFAVETNVAFAHMPGTKAWSQLDCWKLLEETGM